MRQLRTSVGLALLVAVCAWLAAPIAAQKVTAPLPPDIGDLSNAQFMIIKDSAGATVLRGRLIMQSSDDGDIERECEFVGTGAYAKAEGDGEVEVKQVGDRLVQQVDVEVEGLSPNTAYTVFVDSKQVGTITTDAHGEAEVELETPPAATSTPAPAPAVASAPSKK